MKKYGAVANLPREKQHFHVLKHSIATHLLDAGADLRFASDTSLDGALATGASLERRARAGGHQAVRGNLKLPSDPEVFITKLRDEMRTELHSLQ